MWIAIFGAFVLVTVFLPRGLIGLVPAEARAR